MRGIPCHSLAGDVLSLEVSPASLGSLALMMSEAGLRPLYGCLLGNVVKSLVL